MFVFGYFDSENIILDNENKHFSGLPKLYDG